MGYLQYVAKNGRISRLINIAVLFVMMMAQSAFFLSPKPAQAYSIWRGYGGLVNETSVSLDMTVGETRTIILTYTNVGEKTWTKGAGYGNVALFFVGEGTSPLQDSSWIDAETPGRIKDASVAPNGSTTISFRVHASKAGTYSNVFRLAADDVAWMRDAETKVTVNVSGSGSVAVPSAGTETITQPTASTETSAPASVTSGVDYKGLLLLRSTKSISLPGSTKASVTYGFKNTGDAIWQNRALKLASVHSATVNASTSWLYDSSWTGTDQPVIESTPTKPGEIGFLSFDFKTPPKRGEYTVRFALIADGKQVEGAYVDIPITVTSDGAYDATPISVPSGSTEITDPNAILKHESFLAEEPIIRVGLFPTSDDRMMVKGLTGPYRVHQQGKTICEFSKDQTVTVSFDRTHLVYKLSGPGCTGQSSAPYQVQSTVSDWEPLEMTDYSRPVSWLPGANDNTFRGILELRYASEDDDQDVWTINELPIEYYLRGIAETSDVSPLEYQKALLIAARTYAYYHWSRGTKHAVRNFHIHGKYDQVYRGYGAEARSPKIVQAVTETRGQIVTYDNKLAITPYFSRSDGRTRSWGEVWYGGSNYPWLVSVSVPQDAGRTLWGHGVGMSASGALGMANEGSNYIEILKHFYTGIQLMLFY